MRDVAQRQAINDAFRCRLLLRFGNRAHGHVAGRGAVLRDIADDQAGPQTKHGGHVVKGAEVL